MTWTHHHAHPAVRRDVDMTQGSITRHLVEFALPLLAGNVFQQLYNMVDTWVVGNFVSNEAFSAVGTVGPIINMLIGFFMGLSSGAGVVISQYYGAHKPDRVRDTVHTAMVLTLVLCGAFTALGLALIPAMLALMNTPAEVLPESTAYLSIYFSGITGLLIYNMGSGILRAVGDSRRPFYFLVVSAGLNTVLDLVFVIRFRMGVAGVAWATIIAQAASEGCRLLSANALYLIHTAICSTEGNAAEIAGKIDLLHQTDARIAAVYASRSGRPAAEFEALMAENNGNGRWLAPEEAVAAGLADKVVEAAEQPASSLARNIARGWERLLANIGLRPGPALPADRNVLHFDGEVQALRSRSAVAADEARRQAAPTSTQPREDPSCGDTVRSANERAYAEDARRMRN